jgi:hypothetical protein
MPQLTAAQIPDVEAMTLILYIDTDVADVSPLMDLFYIYTVKT